MPPAAARARPVRRVPRSLRTPSSSSPSSSLSPWLPVLRAIVAGAAVRAHARALCATRGVLHGPRNAQLIATAAFVSFFVISNLFRRSRADTLAVVTAALALLFTSAAQPHLAAFASAATASLALRPASRQSQLVGVVSFAVALAASPTFVVPSWPDALPKPPPNALPAGAWALALAAQAISSMPRRRIGAAKRSAAHKSTPPALIALVAVAVTLAGYVLLPLAGESLTQPLPRGYSLIAHARGPTGRISVLYDSFRRARFLISDHSILGGRYTAPEHAAETVFAQFHVHEAVRLTHGPGRRALCIGLGAGVVAQALHEHGVSVDGVEIDGVVARFAQRYFGLRGPRIHVADGVKWLTTAPQATFDYVVHDVFTGGAVPTRLFAVDTFRLIKSSMQHDGVLAVNFVGALDDRDAVRAVSAVRARLQHVWQHVSMYGEDANNTVVNVVFFATDSADRLRFRKPTADDALGSEIRFNTLNSFESRRLDDEQVATMSIEDATDAHINAGQWITARVHWHAMRGILNDSVWYALAATTKESDW